MDFQETYPDMLDDLAVEFGGDKSTHCHGYTRWYERHLEPRRQSVRSVLEIGIGEGPSLKIWKNYFPSARIVGVDNAPHIANAPDTDAVRILATQGEPEMLVEAVCPWAPYDLIVDDGSHRWRDQISSFQAVSRDPGCHK